MTVGLKERRAEAEAALVRARRGEETPRTLSAQGYSFYLADLGLQISVLGKRCIAELPFTLPELRGRLQAMVGAPPYRTESLYEAYSYPLLVFGPEGPACEAHLAFGEDGAGLFGDEAHRSDWPEAIEALRLALESASVADFADKVWDPGAGAWIYYGIRAGQPFEDVIEGEDPPEWAD